MNIKYNFLKTIDSTNSEAKRKCAAALETGAPSAGALHNVAFIAEEQTAGRGRLDRKFYSPAGSGVYFSFVYSPKNEVDNPAKFTVAASVAVCEAVQELFGVKCGIKWVNDVFYNGKKVCGILTEGVLKDGEIKTVIVGIGINLFDWEDEDVPEDIKNIAGGILKKSVVEPIETTGATVLREPQQPNCEIKKRLAVAICEKLSAFYDEMDKSELLPKKITEAYKNWSILKGKLVTINPVAGVDASSGSTGFPTEMPHTYEAKVLGIDDEANLIVETIPTNDGETPEIYHLKTGEVSIGSGQITTV